MYPNESCRSVECDRCMFTRRGTVIRTSSGRTSACLRGRVRMHSSRESAGAQRARGFRTCVFERANQLERRSPTTPCPNRRTCSWTRVRFTRKLYGMIPKPLARTSAAGGHEIKLAERLHSDQSTFTSGCSAVLFVPMMTADVAERVMACQSGTGSTCDGCDVVMTRRPTSTAGDGAVAVVVLRRR